VFDKGPIVGQEGGQLAPALVRGAGSRMFFVYEGWAEGKTYNAGGIRGGRGWGFEPGRMTCGI